MYFGLSEEQSFFQDNVRKYLEEHATLDNIKHIANGDEKNLSAEIHQGLLNLGINALLIPEEFGGLGLDLLFAAVVSEALGGGVGPIPFIAPYVMAPTAIKHAGSKTQQENYLSKTATNEYRFGVGFTEFIDEFSKTNSKSIFIGGGFRKIIFLLSFATCVLNSCRRHNIGCNKWNRANTTS